MIIIPLELGNRKCRNISEFSEFSGKGWEFRWFTYWQVAQQSSIFDETTRLKNPNISLPILERESLPNCGGHDGFLESLKVCSVKTWSNGAGCPKNCSKSEATTLSFLLLMFSDVFGTFAFFGTKGKSWCTLELQGRSHKHSLGIQTQTTTSPPRVQTSGQTGCHGWQHVCHGQFSWGCYYWCTLHLVTIKNVGTLGMLQRC